MIRRFAAKKGDVLFQPGQRCPGFLLLDRGRIRVSLTSAAGREVVLYRVAPGDVCLQSFSCLLNDETYTAEGVVEEDLAGELVLPAAFHARLSSDAGFRDRVMGAVARRFGEFERLVEDVALTGFDSRLARVLLRLDDGSGFVPATHAALAAETASGRAFVSRRLAAFAQDGLCVQEKGGVRLKDLAGLERIAADQR